MAVVEHPFYSSKLIGPGHNRVNLACIPDALYRNRIGAIHKIVRFSKIQVLGGDAEDSKRLFRWRFARLRAAASILERRKYLETKTRK